MKNKRIWDMSPAELEQIIKDSGVSLYGNFKKIGKPKLKKLLPGKYDVDYTFSIRVGSLGRRELLITLFNPDLPDSFWERGYSYVDDHAVRRVAICV
jgi:hypothetical protein